MGTVYRKTATKPLPQGAEVFSRTGQRFARWKSAKEKSRTAPLTTGTDGTERIVVEARTFTAKYRDGSGVVREVATGCRDEAAARSVLGELERRAELIKAGVLTSAEDAVADHQATPLAVHLDAYRDNQTAKGLNQTRMRNTSARLKRLADECNFGCLADLDAGPLDRWLSARAAEGMSAGTRNEYRQELIGFANWCMRTRRLIGNPFQFVPKADAKADCRRKRRSLTEVELVALLDAARRRPLLEALTVRRGKRQGEKLANIRPEVRADLERLGRERALIYKTLLLTGLRKGELASLTVGQMHLDGDLPYMELDAADEKNRQGSSIPLRTDLAADLRAWLDAKAVALRARTQATTLPFDTMTVRTTNRQRLDAVASQGQLRQRVTDATGLPTDMPLFNVPTGLLRILDRDLVLAGLARRVQVEGKWIIDKSDERGRTIDVHALRHTYGTLLSKAGVAPRTAQAAMRHSSIDLTMNVYTDPKLLDVAGALESLPSLPLDPEAGQSQAARIAVRATGTDDCRLSPFAPAFAPTVDESCKLWSSPDKSSATERTRIDAPRNVVSVDVDKRNKPLTTCVSGLHQVERKGVEPSTSALRTQRSPN